MIKSDECNIGLKFRHIQAIYKIITLFLNYLLTADFLQQINKPVINQRKQFSVFCLEEIDIHISGGQTQNQ